MDKQEGFLKAVDAGDVEEIIKYLSEGIDVETSIQYGTTPLMQAALNGKLDIVKLLVEKGADVNKFNQLQWTALCYAATRNHYDVVDFLAKSGADINAVCQSGSTILEWVIRQQDNRISMVELLLERGAEIKPSTIKSAEVNQEEDILKLLVKQSNLPSNKTSTMSAENKKKPWWKVW